VHFWTGSRDTLVERNTIVDCARGIGFGLGERTDWARRYPDQAGQGYVGHYGGLIRNNLVVATRPGMDTGIGLEQASGARVYHNTVYAGPGATGYFSSLDYRFPNTFADLRNNLVTRITARNGATAQLARHVEWCRPDGSAMRPGSTSICGAGQPVRSTAACGRERPASTSTAGLTRSDARTSGQTSPSDDADYDAARMGSALAFAARRLSRRRY
jgi:hypothetical protein